MLKKLIPYIIVLLFVVSCYKFKEPEKPKNLISKADMVNILIDLKLIASITAANDIKVLDSSNVQSEKYIYKKYNIDSIQFALSNNYYAYHLEEYEDIYTKVKDSLEALSSFYDALELKELDEQRTKDSLKSLAKNDSIKEINAKEEMKRRLIKPVSDTDSLP
ncbi:DUF4296 domain-containing protein [Confluentibacter flavum]|uniref:DUF4296 domain-containing protein n=1 Tax=Confluentibacter flavum TaxID=1909700 RepID=A0A2N3HIW2_9FLAO|nr:DUF4296 domain-containing protein [Confluentibacter flavum]PKQ44909.1 hypothetical protein CSW08_10890 [Confluentibacter flavum]